MSTVSVASASSSSPTGLHAASAVPLADPLAGPEPEAEPEPEPEPLPSLTSRTAPPSSSSPHAARPKANMPTSSQRRCFGDSDGIATDPPLRGLGVEIGGRVVRHGPPPDVGGSAGGDQPGAVAHPVADGRRAQLGQRQAPRPRERVGGGREVDDEAAILERRRRRRAARPTTRHPRRRRAATAVGRPSATCAAHQATASTASGSTTTTWRPGHHQPCIVSATQVAVRPARGERGDAAQPARRAAGAGRARRRRERRAATAAPTQPARSRGRRAGRAAAGSARRSSGGAPTTVSSPPTKWSPAAYTVQPP